MTTGTRTCSCQHCGYKRASRPIEKDWDWLERCPRCGAYDWSPPPVRVREDGTLYPDQEDAS